MTGPAVPGVSRPCGACGRPVNPTPGRRRGTAWWHLNEDCQAARDRHHCELARARRGLPALHAQPCGWCGLPVPSASGRWAGQTWWHADRPECRAARDRAHEAARRERARAADRRAPLAGAA